MPTPIVVHTNVIIGALIGKDGPNRAVLRHCLTGLFSPLISNSLFLEYEAVSSRGSILERCPLPMSEIRELLNAYYNVCQWIPIYYLWRPSLSDENDNFLVELAVAGNAFCIVTNNVNDLKGSELTFPDIRILRPTELLAWLH